jgi:hypothetical protein
MLVSVVRSGLATIIFGLSDHRTIEPGDRQTVIAYSTDITTTQPDRPDNKSSIADYTPS